MNKPALYSHIETTHPQYLNEKMSASRLYFNMKNKKEKGQCIICRLETPWNEATERYDRLHNGKCTEIYREQFKTRMISKHGKVHLLDSPEQQKKMLANRKISGEYTWSDGISKTQYVGSYELDFLKFLDLFLEMNPSDVVCPAPQVFRYIDEDGKERFYIPDMYIPSINTLVEIKDGGKNPNMHHKIQDVDKKREALKDSVLRSQKDFNYVKVTDKEYHTFMNFLMKLKQEEISEKEIKKPVIMIGEASKIFRQLHPSEGIIQEGEDIMSEINKEFGF